MENFMFCAVYEKGEYIRLAQDAFRTSSEGKDERHHPDVFKTSSRRKMLARNFLKIVENLFFITAESIYKFLQVKYWIFNVYIAQKIPILLMNLSCNGILHRPH